MEKFSIDHTPRDPNAPRRELASGTSVPHLASDQKLSSPSFWANLKDFLTERSVNVSPNAKQEVFRTDGVDSSFAESFKAFFSATPRFKGPVPSGMVVDFQPGYRVLWNNLRDLISPPKLPPLKLTSKPVPVRPLWAKRQEFSVAQSISIGVHALAILLIVGFTLHHVVEEKKAAANLGMVDISPYMPLAAAKDKAGGGGGGGQRMPDPPTRGKAPKFALTQLAPPMAKPLLDAKLAVEPTLLRAARPESCYYERPELWRSAGRDDYWLRRLRRRQRNWHR